MSGNICPVAPVGNFQYGLPACNDIDYIDLGVAPYPMSMDGSIFGGMPMVGGGVYNNQSYFDNMRQQQQFYNQYYIDQQRMSRNADLQINGAMEAVAETAAHLKDKILQNEQDQIMESYNKYVEAVRNAYGSGSAEEINGRALALYQRMNNGKTLIEDLREHSHSSFLQGFLQSVTLGTYYRSSAEDNISQITGQSVAEGQKTIQNIGRLAGIATVGGGAYAAAKSNLLSNIGKFKISGKAGWIGLAAAGLATLATFLTGKVST